MLDTKNPTNPFLSAITQVRAAFDCGALHDWAVYEDRSTFGNGARHIVVLPAEGDWIEVFDEGETNQ